MRSAVPTTAGSGPIPAGAGAPPSTAGPGGTVVDLATDRPRTAAGSGAGVGRVRLALPAPLGTDLARLAGRAGVSFDLVALAAFAVLLRKYTGQDDILVGVELPGHGEGVVRMAIDPAAPFLDHLPSLRAAVARMGGRPLDANVRFAGHAGPAPAPTGADLILALDQDGAEPSLVLDHHDGLFEPDTVRRLAGHLHRLLAAVAARPDLPVRRLDLLTGDERARILGEFNATGRPYPRDATIHELFARQARRDPAAVAVTGRGRSLTYGELAAAATRLARRLRAFGVRAGDPVGLMLPRSPELVVAALAILEAGGAYVPVDPGYPAERVEYLLADSGASVLVGREPLLAGARFAGRLIEPDGPGEDTSGVDGGMDGGGAVGPTGLAYIAYTSGTTGRPKGVEVRHRGVVRLVCGTEYVALSAATRILPTCAMVFDGATFELWGALLNGGSVHLVDDDTILDAGALGRELAEQAVTTMWLTSPLFNQLVERDPTIFRPLRHLLIGGDALSPRHVGVVLAACPALTLVNGYGPTENTTFSTTQVLAPADLGRIPIGRPIANSTAYVVDPDGQLCPVGVLGELWLGGDGVAAGYRNRPELTASAFVPDPFVPGGTAYRSGDLARWRPDGTLDFHGRRDHQVKVRGFRVELGEIESVLLEHPGVSEVVVLARPRPGGGDKYLCAYHVGSALAGELREYLGRRLPDHLVPSFLVALPAMPLNRNGKVDRGALPEPEGLVEAGAGRRPVRGEVEGAVAELVERALGVRGVGVDDDLRDLGADSLTATVVAAGIEQAFGTRIPVSRLLRDATVERIARRVAATGRPASTAAGHQAPTVIGRAPERPDYPLSPQQRRLFVEQLKDETATHYNVPVTVSLPPEADVARLAAAVQLLAERHESLRTEFVLDAGGEARQRIVPAAMVPVEVREGPLGPVGGFVRPFDLARAPLCRVRIARSADAVRVLLDLHHIVTDGVSLGVLVQDLMALHDDPAGRGLPPVGLRYRDYAEWSAAAAEARRREQGGYWRSVFGPPRHGADLPVDHPRPPIRSVDGGAVRFELGAGRTAGLRRLARKEEVTLFAVLGAVYALLLARLTGHPDVTLGTPVSGRTLPGLGRTVGMFANTVCLRVEAAPGRPFAGFLREVAGAAEEAFAHQEHPFEDLVAAVAPDRDYRRNPLFDALVALHSATYLEVGPPGRRVRLQPEWNGQSVFDLNLQVFEAGESLRARLEYGARLFERATAEGFRDALLELLDAVLADPGAAVGSLVPGAFRVPAGLPDIDFDL